MVLKLHCLPSSTCSRRVLVTLEEAGIPYEIVDVNLFAGEQKGASHLKLQPFGKIPVLDDDGFILYESRAICKYIAKKYGKGKLIPQDGDLKAFALFEQACSVELCQYDGPSFKICYEKVFKQMRGQGPPDEAILEPARKEIEIVFAVYENTLSKQAYLAGDELTVVDLYHLSNGNYIRGVGEKGLFEKFPHVEKWFSGLENSESWKKTISLGKPLPGR
ncbi:hypothetical protein G7Y89_g9695 [Cudoniella acicularis]|uniref:glutathione transferase n=1 Tax=Cudoniella acicularis TaxID=354080 RepID=A0A8H4RGE6_9HELO|nr:hypothetical protein G7Y89_g9695 [Cudoniella acicularis]